MRDFDINDEIAQSSSSINHSDLDSANTSNIFSNLGSISRLFNPQILSIEDLPIMGKKKSAAKTRKTTVDAEEDIQKLLYQPATSTAASSSHRNAPAFADIDPDKVSDIAEGAETFLLAEEEGEEVTSEDKSLWNMVSEEGVTRRFEARFNTTDSLYAVVANKISTIKDIDLRKLHYLGCFPDFIQFRRAGERERLCSPADEQGWVAFSGNYIEAGLRYPFPDFLMVMLNHYKIAITQLAPNSVMEIVCFAAWCRRNLVVESPDLFRKFYSLNEQRAGCASYYVKSASGAPTIFKGKPTSRKDWKEKLFFIRSADPVRPLGLRTSWRKLEPEERSAWSPSEPTTISAKLHSPKLPLDISAWTSPELLSYLGIYKIKLTRAQARATKQFLRTITKYRGPSERVGGENQQVSNPGRGRVLLKPPSGDTVGKPYSVERKRGIVLPIYDLCAKEKKKSPVPAEDDESGANTVSMSGNPNDPACLEVEDSEEETEDDSGALLTRSEKRRREAGLDQSLTPQSKKARSARPNPIQPRAGNVGPSTSAPADEARRHPRRVSPSRSAVRTPHWSSKPNAAKMMTDYGTREDAARAYYEINTPGFEGEYLNLKHRTNMLDIGLLSQNTHLRNKLAEQEELVSDHRFCTAQIKRLDDSNSDVKRQLGHAQTRITELEKERSEARKFKVKIEAELAAEKKERIARQADVTILNERLKTLEAELATRRADPALLALKDSLLNEKEVAVSAVSTSQDSSDLLREQLSVLQDKTVELEGKLAACEATITDLRRSHLHFLRDWVKTDAYVEAFTYSSFTDYTSGYADARHAIFTALREIGLADRLDIGKFRSYENERMFADGRTLRLPVSTRPPINLPELPEDHQEGEWEKPYPSAKPVEGELMDLASSVYEALEEEYAYHLDKANQAQVGNPDQTAAEQQNEGDNGQH